MRRPRICEWRTLSYSFLTACSLVILSDLTDGLRSVPGRLHTCKVAQSQYQKDLDQPLLSLKITRFFPKAQDLPKIHCLLHTPALIGCGPVLRRGESIPSLVDVAHAYPANTRFTSQSGGRSTPGKDRAMPNHRVGQGERLHEFCSTIIDSISD